MKNPITKTTSLLNVFTQQLRQKGYVVETWRSMFYSREHFPKILAMVMVTGTTTGYLTMDYIHNSRIRRRDEMYQAAWDAHSHRRYSLHNKDNQDDSLETFNCVRRLTRKMTIRRINNADTSDNSTVQISY